MDRIPDGLVLERLVIPNTAISSQEQDNQQILTAQATPLLHKAFLGSLLIVKR